MDDDLEATLWVIGILLAFVCCGAGFMSAFHISTAPGHGQQIGYITEIENSGIVWRPDEIVLIGSEATFSDSQTSWEYGSANPEVTDQARHYIFTHDKVVVKYETDMIVFGWEYSNNARIVSITRADELK